MKKSGAEPSPVVPGKYFVFVERLVREQYQTLVVDADSEEAARDSALKTFFAGSVAYNTIDTDTSASVAGGSSISRSDENWTHWPT